MIVINNVSKRDWTMILAALNCYKRDEVFNMISGKGRKNDLDQLIKKVIGFTEYNDSPNNFKMEYESKWIGKSE